MNIELSDITNKEQEIRAKIQKLVSDYCDLKFKDDVFIPGESMVPVSGKVIGISEIQNMVDSSLD